MDEIMNTPVEEPTQPNFIEEGATDAEDELFRAAVEEQLRKVQRQNLMIGAQTVCSVILEKVMAAMKQPGKRTMNDYKRLVKDIENFCRTGLSRKVNADGETEPVEEEVVTNESTERTVQN
jgi:hypothetical protein